MALGCWEDHVERCVDNHVMEKRLLKLYCSLGSLLFLDDRASVEPFSSLTVESSATCWWKRVMAVKQLKNTWIRP